jgi:hypothetical protein
MFVLGNHENQPLDLQNSECQTKPGLLLWIRIESIIRIWEPRAAMKVQEAIASVLFGGLVLAIMLWAAKGLI